MTVPNGWSRNEKYVLEELKRLSGAVESMNTCLLSVKTDIAMLKLKSSLWGALGGFVAVAVYVLIAVLRN